MNTSKICFFTINAHVPTILDIIPVKRTYVLINLVTKYSYIFKTIKFLLCAVFMNSVRHTLLTFRCMFKLFTT